MNLEEANTRMQAKIDWFQQDLAYTAPELHEMKWVRFKMLMADLIESIFDEVKVMTQESSIRKCHTCGTTTISFDPPLYFEAEETCGYEMTFYITSVHHTKEIHEHCVNYKGHEYSTTPDKRRHYALIEELVYFSGTD